MTELTTAELIRSLQDDLSELEKVAVQLSASLEARPNDHGLVAALESLNVRRERVQDELRVALGALQKDERIIEAPDPNAQRRRTKHG